MSQKQVFFLFDIRQGWAILFTRRAAFEKNLKPRAALVIFLPLKIGEEQKKVYLSYTFAEVLFLPLKIGEEQKRFTVNK